MNIFYQLSRDNCPPCQVLKQKVLNIKDPKFKYVYVNVDTIREGTIEYDILMDAKKNKISSLPIVGITEFEDDVESIKFVINVKSQNIDDFLEIIQ